MCGDWISLDDEVRRILNGLAVEPGEESDTTATALAKEGDPGCAHDAKGLGGVVLEFVKRGGDRSRPQWVLQGGIEHGESTADGTRHRVSMFDLPGSARHALRR